MIISHENTFVCSFISLQRVIWLLRDAEQSSRCLLVWAVWRMVVRRVLVQWTCLVGRWWMRMGVSIGRLNVRRVNDHGSLLFWLHIEMIQDEYQNHSCYHDWVEDNQQTRIADQSVISTTDNDILQQDIWFGGDDVVVNDGRNPLLHTMASPDPRITTSTVCVVLVRGLKNLTVALSWEVTGDGTAIWKTWRELSSVIVLVTVTSFVLVICKKKNKLLLTSNT